MCVCGCRCLRVCTAHTPPPHLVVGTEQQRLHLHSLADCGHPVANRGRRGDDGVGHTRAGAGSCCRDGSGRQCGHSGGDGGLREGRAVTLLAVGLPALWAEGAVGGGQGGGALAAGAEHDRAARQAEWLHRHGHGHGLAGLLLLARAHREAVRDQGLWPNLKRMGG